MGEMDEMEGTQLGSRAGFVAAERVGGVEHVGRMMTCICTVGWHHRDCPYQVPFTEHAGVHWPARRPD